MKSTTIKVTEADEREGLSYDLPEGWAATTLSEVCEVNPPKPSANVVAQFAPVTFVPMPAVDADMGAITAPQERPFSSVRKGYTAFREGDVIMAKITPCMENGKAAITRNLKNGLGFGSTEFHVLRSTFAILPGYVYRFIRRESYRKAAESEMTGSVGQKRVPADFIARSAIELPPLAEQTRIVAKIEELLKNVNASRDHLAKVPKILKAFRQSVLAAACSGRLTEDWRNLHSDQESANELIKRIRKSHERNGVDHGGQAATPTEDVHTLSKEDLPEKWTLEELKWLCRPERPITYGILKPGSNQAKGIPYVRVADFPGNRLNLAGIRLTTPEIAHQYRRSALLPGDVLLSIRGTVGRICRVPDELAGANITQDTARISVHTEILADYIQLYLQCPSAQKRFEAAMKGVAVRGVNIGDVRVLQIAVPPVAEQQEIVRRVEALFKLADTIEKRIEAATKHADKLTQAVLAKAFRGELVTTEAELARREGRDYEPASVLLDRIRASRQAKTGKQSTTRRARTKRRK